MAVFQVETPRGVIDVEAPDNATDAEIIERAKVIYDNVGGPVEPETTGQEGDAGMAQARVLGALTGTAYAVGGSVPGAIGKTISAVRDISQAKAPPVLEQKYPGLQGLDITQNQQALKSAQDQLAQQKTLLARETDPSGRRVIQDNIRRLEQQAAEAQRGLQMGRSAAAQNVRNAPIAQIPGRVQELAATYAPKTTAVAGKLTNFAGKVVGPYGAITSAQDATQRYRSAQSPMDYVQSGISALGSAGYGASMIPHPVTKFGGMAVGGAADLANYTIDALRQKQYTDIDRQIREEAARKAMGQQ